MAPVKFYLDEDLSDTIAIIATNLGIDTTSAHGTAREELIDEEQLHVAAQEDRCIVTINGPDFIALAVRFFEHGGKHAGVLVIPRQVPRDRFAAVAHALVEYDHAHPEGMQPYAIDYLDV